MALDTPSYEVFYHSYRYCHLPKYSPFLLTHPYNTNKNLKNWHVTNNYLIKCGVIRSSMHHMPFGCTDRNVYILAVTVHDPVSLTFISSRQFVCIYGSAKLVRIPAETKHFSILQHVQTDCGADTNPLLNWYGDKAAGSWSWQPISI